MLRCVANREQAYMLRNRIDGPLTVQIAEFPDSLAARLRRMAVHPRAGFLGVLGGFARYRFCFRHTRLTIAPPDAILPYVIVSRSRPGLRKLSLQRLYHTRSIGAGRWSPDGRRICFASNASGRQNIWVADSNGGWPLQLTVSDQRQIPGGWSPDGKWITFQSDHDADAPWARF